MEDKPSIEQISHLFRLIGDGSCTRTNLQAYLEKPNGLIDKSVSTTAIIITMDCTRSLKEMIKAGRYDWTNSDIKDKNFPITEKGVFNTEAVLVHYNKVMKTEDILRDMESKGLVQGKIEHLLAVGEKYPNLQRDFPIVALGSSWQDPVGFRVVPYLSGDDSGRGLSLVWSDRDWDEDYRFLAVRK